MFRILFGGAVATVAACLFLSSTVAQSKDDEIQAYASTTTRGSTRVAYFGKAAGELVIVATVSHKRQMRQRAREALGPFLEICLLCPVDVCRERDAKEVYVRADHEYVAGVTEPYELSPPPAVRIDTGQLGIEASVQVAVEEALAFVRGS